MLTAFFAGGFFPHHGQAEHQIGQICSRYKSAMSSSLPQFPSLKAVPSSSQIAMLESAIIAVEGQNLSFHENQNESTLDEDDENEDDENDDDDDNQSECSKPQTKRKSEKAKWTTEEVRFHRNGITKNAISAVGDLLFRSAFIFTLSFIFKIGQYITSSRCPPEWKELEACGKRFGRQNRSSVPTPMDQSVEPHPDQGTVDRTGQFYLCMAHAAPYRKDCSIVAK